MPETEHDFNEILFIYQDAVYNQAYRMLGSVEDAEDATQDIFLRIHGALDRFRGESKISSWIYRITANVCISRLRKKQRAALNIESIIDSAGQMLPELLPNRNENPEYEYAEKQRAQFVYNEIRNLPPLWAQALSLHYFGDRSYDEIADVMSIPKGTVATYISRGKKRLAKKLMSRFGKDI